MATPIDRDQLIVDENLWLPSSNILTESQMRSINEYVIAQVGDDEENYAEVLCKALQAIALTNKAQASANTGGLKKEKTGDVAIEWQNTGSASKVWEGYLDSLKDLCPIFGYTGLNNNIGIGITTPTCVVVNPTCCSGYRNCGSCGGSSHDSCCPTTNTLVCNCSCNNNLGF